MLSPPSQSCVMLAHRASRSGPARLLHVPHAAALALAMLLPSPLPLRVADGARGAARVDLLKSPAGGLRFAADGSIVVGQSIFVDSVCGDDLADGRTAKTAFATVDTAVASLRASPNKETTVFVRVGQAHRMVPRDANDPLADWSMVAVRPWHYELDKADKLDSRGCPFNEEILIGISTPPGSTAVCSLALLTLRSSHGMVLPPPLQLPPPPVPAHTRTLSTRLLGECAQIGEVRLAGWDISVQGRVAPKATLLLYLFLVEVPPQEEHRVILNARGTAKLRASRQCSTVRAASVFLTAAVVVCTAGLVSDRDYFIRLKGVAGGDDVKASGAALASGRFQLTIPAPASRLGAQGG